MSLPPLPDLELGSHRARRATEVRSCDHVEHDLGRRGDHALDRPERTHATPDAEVERQRAADE
jgi:hypothetical protein